MLKQLLANAQRDRERAANAWRIGAGFAVTLRYVWAVSKWALLLIGLGILALVWIILTIIFQPLRGK